MSHDFAFWNSDEPLENEEANEIYREIVANGCSSKINPASKIAQLAADIRSRWPVPTSGDEDDWPLSTEIDVSASHVIVCIVPSRVWDVWPTIGQLAKEYGLVMYDPQQSHVFLPQGLSRKRTRERAKKRRDDRAK